MSAADPRELQALFAEARAPRSLTREDRVRLIGETAQALLAGRLPGREAALFTGGALSAWLERGGSLERDFLRVTLRGSHLTPQRIAALIADERQPGLDALPSAPSISEEGPDT